MEGNHLEHRLCGSHRFFHVANVAEFCSEVDLGCGCTLVCFWLLEYRWEYDVWGRLSGFRFGSILSAPDVRTFFAFTVPLIRAVFYSVGAYISSLVYHARVSLADGC
jgi:hypothetical protein